MAKIYRMPKNVHYSDHIDNFVSDTLLEVCRVCGSKEVHTQKYNKPTMKCIEFLRKKAESEINSWKQIWEYFKTLDGFTEHSEHLIKEYQSYGCATHIVTYIEQLIEKKGTENVNQEIEKQSVEQNKTT